MCVRSGDVGNLLWQAEGVTHMPIIILLTGEGNLTRENSMQESHELASYHATTEWGMKYGESRLMDTRIKPELAER